MLLPSVQSALGSVLERGSEQQEEDRLGEQFCEISVLFDRFQSVHREERNQTQVLRQQQDEAYLASLRADQEKERKKREERERKRRKEEEVQQQKLAEERRRQVSHTAVPCLCFAASLQPGRPFPQYSVPAEAAVHAVCRLVLVSYREEVFF